ncbi:MAG: DUF1684 domain-containing protein [Flavobacterium sp.]|uniref:DUF1684 domain-containing protein n=1 Tax=Flavobacterium sp. TaxID=239 RepID=UPI002624D245|nr:DUF1684 domain-containing protein [Flavobacterium sp.]MDD5149959.1 DUF1684 domain-containing protein [Flavobacterium sp.]
MKNILTLFFLGILNFGFCQEKFDIASVEKFQKDLNIEFADAKTSPLDAEDLKEFKALDFYPITEKFYVIAKFVRTENEMPFEMKTSTDRKPMYVKYGIVQFSIDGKSFQLNVYKNIELSKKEEYKDYLFLPFSDLTSGNESYIGGKYIDLKIPKEDTIAIDFNTSYNPYCAYSHRYSCPIVPLENDLNIEINAGVKKFHD